MTVMLKKKKLLWQLYPYFLLIVLISIVPVSIYAANSFKQFFLKQTENDLRARAELIKKLVSPHLEPLNIDSIDNICKEVGESSSARVTIILPLGRVVGDSDEDIRKMDNHGSRPEIIGAYKKGSGKSTRFSKTLKRYMMYVAVTILSRDQSVRADGNMPDKIAAIVRTAIPVDTIDREIKDIELKIALGALIMAVISAILSFVLSRRIAQPIREIKEGAECFSRGEFKCRLPISNLTEIGSLSETMNAMAEQLDNRIKTEIRQRNELEAVLTSMLEGVVAVDMDERIISMNNAAAIMLDCETENVKGRSIQEVARNTDLQTFVGNVLKSGELIEKDIFLYSDKERVINLHGTNLHGEDEKNMGALIVLNDVTKLRHLENVRKDFVANVSHEIKTPLTAIKGFAETLKDGAIKNPLDAERFLGIIHKHVNRLENIIEDLLSLSRIEKEDERGEIILEKGSVKSVLETSVLLCQSKAKEKQIKLELYCPEDILYRINTPLLEQAVVNLLDNAVKYSDEGKRVRVEALQTEEVRIDVIDEGCGIKKDQLPRLFERFYRADKARSREMGGTGLGLAIVKHISQAHSGKITVESTFGQGSVFSIHLPLQED